MTVATAAPERFDIGRVLSGGFDNVRRQPVTLIVLTLLFGYLPAAATQWLTTHWLPPPAAAAANLGAYFGRFAMVELIGVAIGGFGWVLQGTAAAAVLSSLAGRPLNAVQALARTAPRLPMVYLLGVLSTLAILAGTLAVVVPGVLLALAWSIGGSVAAIENTGLRSFGRSAELTRGNRVSLLIILLVYGIAGFVLSVVARIAGGGALVAAGGTDPIWLTLGLQPLASAVVQLFLNATLVAAYLELRGANEGLTAAGLAALFD